MVRDVDKDIRRRLARVAEAETALGAGAKGRGKSTRMR
jgi:hypothetical protein